MTERNTRITERDTRMTERNTNFSTRQERMIFRGVIDAYQVPSCHRVNTACSLLIEHKVDVVDVIVVLTFTHRHDAMQSVVAGQAPTTLE